MIITKYRSTRNWGTISPNGAVGEVVAGNNLHVSFTVPTMGNYYIETAQPNIPYGVKSDTKLYLYDSSGALLASNDDINGSENRYSRIQRTLSSGTYTVWIVEYGSPYNKINNVGAYLTIWGSDALCYLQSNCFSQTYANLCMDFVKISNGGEYGKDGSYNCLAYALDKNASSVVWPWSGNPTPAQSKAYLQSLGYTARSTNSSNCIVEYIGTDGRITHYSRIDNNVVTAKCGQLERMRHSGYKCYFEQIYGKSNMFYVK